MSSSTDPSKKHDFMLVVEVTLGNPNGDPDLDNQPRQNGRPPTRRGRFPIEIQNDEREPHRRQMQRGQG